MSVASINGNVLSVSLSTLSRGQLAVDMSLQRHDYRYCGGAAAAANNSLIYSDVSDATLIAEATEFGNQVEALLKDPKLPYGNLFGKLFTVSSGRTYLLDNSALNPRGWPNHFFVTGGSHVWAEMTSDQFVAAAAIRRVEEAITAATSSSVNYLDPKALYALSQTPGGRDNPVIRAYVAAHTALNKVPNADNALSSVSGRPEIVAISRRLY